MSFQDLSSRLKRENLNLSCYNQTFDCHLNGNKASQRRLEVEEKRGDLKIAEEEEEEGIELSLGLSLHGRFGVDPIRANKITRSSSIANFIIPSNDRNETLDVLPGAQGNRVNLLRTCSLPVETEEEWRKRKDMQMLRRMEAKRKRSEKQQQRTWKSAAKERVISSGEVNSLIEEENCQATTFWVKPSTGSDGFSSSTLLGHSRQGSIGSQGSASSGLSESESLHAQQEYERKSIIVQTPGLGGDQTAAKNGARSILVDMPHVSTKGVGPNGRKTEGFLYQYGKREEVRIVCVCHGKFHTPSEFVKHAGGGDVAYPLRHIVVDPTPLI